MIAAARARPSGSGIAPDAHAPAQAAGLVEIGARVRFRHPLVRSAAYRAATAPERREAHRVLAEATDPQLDPDRRAWHRAHAAEGLDEAVADELERSAGRAQTRGGIAATAAFLERATALTPDPASRSRRALQAAQANFESAAPDAALELLTLAEGGPLDELQRARLARLRAEIVFALRRGRDAPPLLLAAARAARVARRRTRPRDLPRGARRGDVRGLRRPRGRRGRTRARCPARSARSTSCSTA